MKRLAVINGHPDPRPERFCGALSEAYANGASAGGWQTRRVNVGELSLSSIAAIDRGEAARGDIAAALCDIEWANRLAIIYPLWFDRAPDGLRALFDRLSMRRRAHVIVTMDMPAFAYRSLLRKGAPKNANGLSIPGVIVEEPVMIGCVRTITQDQRRGWLETARECGERRSCGTTPAPSRPFGIASLVDRTVTLLRSGFA